MLPEFLAGSYQKYKQDTNLFTTWLAQAAASCGYKPTEVHLQHSSSQPTQSEPSKPPSGRPRLKGKERKAAKDAAAKETKTSPSTGDAKTEPATTVKYTVTTKELLKQAKLVADSATKPRITMPSSLRGIVESAIKARQRCTEWFQQSKVQNKYSDQQHIHFVKVLEDSLSILEPCIEDGPSTQKPQNLPTDQIGDVSATNRFESLPIEITPDDDDEHISEIVTSINTSKKTPMSKGKPVIESFELEDEDRDDNDLAFQIFCFFEDLHRIQEYIGSLWKGYKAGETDLHVAAVTTNSAFGLVRRSEDQILSIAPKLFNKKRSWDTIAIIIFYADAFQQGICPETKLGTNESLRITPFDDFIYLSTARILMKFTYLSEASSEIKSQYPVPCYSLRHGYVSRPELLETPGMRRKEEEDLRLSQYIIDKILFSVIKEQLSKSEEGSEIPLDDEFNAGLEKLITKGAISVTAVFAAQIYIDIHDIMGEKVSKGYDDLRKSTKEIDEIMNLRVFDGAWDVGGSGERWHSKDMEIPLRIKMTSVKWVMKNHFTMFKQFHLEQHPQEDPEVLTCAPPSQPSRPSETLRPSRNENNKSKAASTTRPKPPKDPGFSTMTMAIQQIPERFRHVDLNNMSPELTRHLREELVASGQLPDDSPVTEEHEESARRLNLRPIKASNDCAFFMKSNPVYCGLLSFNLLTDFEAAGLALTNWHKTIWPTAHLYNALRQTSNLERQWREMEDFIELRMEELFAGQLPLSGVEFFSRFALSLGVSPVMFARNPRRRTDNSLVMRPGVIGTKFKISPITKIFRQYFEQKESLETCLVHLETLIKKPGFEGNRKEREAAKRPLTNLQFLKLLKIHLAHEVPRLQFDYITLTKQCAQVLKDVRTIIGLELQIQYPRQNTEDSADQTFPLVVMNMLEETKEWASGQRTLARGGGNAMIGPQLSVASEVMQNFIKTSNPQELIKNFNQLPRNPRAPSGLIPNHWNISIRHVSLSPPGDLVFFVNPESHFVHSEGPIQTVEGQMPGHKLNPKSLFTLQVIAGLIIKAFTTGFGTTREGWAPWSWSTHDKDFARRITKVMRDLGVTQEPLLTMTVAGPEECASVDEDWKGLLRTLTGQA